MRDRFERSLGHMDRARQVLPAGVSSAPRADQRPTPLAIERADGARLIDVDGNEYIDYLAGWGPMILGNRPQPVVDAIAQQLEAGLLFGRQHAGEAELAERLARLVPGVEVSAFFSSGSEAVHAALGAAQAITGRHKLVKFAGHYHGWIHPMAVNLPGMPAASGEPPFAVIPAPGWSASPDVVISPWDDISALDAIFERHPGEIAAVIMEPIACNGGVLVARDGYLAATKELCRRHGSLLIFDEVVTGFRMALGGAQERLGVVPDISVFAKAMASGLPISAVGASRDVMGAALRAGFAFRGTYNGGPVAVAAANATLAQLEQGAAEIYDRLDGLGNRLARGLRRCAERVGAPLVVNQYSSVLGLLWAVSDPATTYAAVAERSVSAARLLDEELLRLGVHTMLGERMYVSAAHTEGDIDITVDAAESALQSVLRRQEEGSTAATGAPER